MWVYPRLACGARPLIALVAVCVVCAVWLLSAAPAALAHPVGHTALDTAVLAQGGGSGNGLDKLSEVLDNLRNWLIAILAALATAYLTVGGVRYLMAGGDLGEIDAAKRCFKCAGIGYALAMLAPFVVGALTSIVGTVQ